MAGDLPVLVEVSRGATIEAKHRGSIVAVEPGGRIISRLGNGNLVTSTRSTIKPIQAIPLITSGAADRFSISSRELAVICASHNGEPLHTFTVARILARIGLNESALRCGAHRPYSEETAIKLDREALSYTQLHNNCSGKHAGMLASAVHLGLSTEDYVSPDHEVQKRIVSIFLRLSGLNGDMPVAVDGCSAPTFGVPLVSLALAFARLVSPWNAGGIDGDSHLLSEAEKEAAKRVIAAMTTHPQIVGGTKGRLDTELIRAARGSLIGKIGAEAVYAVGVLPCERFPSGFGLAIKIEDGARRALDPVVVETLAQLGALTNTALDELAWCHRPAVVNHRGSVVGEVRPVFHLEIAGR